MSGQAVGMHVEMSLRKQATRNKCVCGVCMEEECKLVCVLLLGVVG